MKSSGKDPSRSSANWLMLNPSVIPDFADSTLEWRRMFAEIWGTFLLVLVAAGGGVVRALSGRNLSLAMIVVAPGLMVVERFFRENDRTRYGFMNAVTSVARDTRDHVTRWRLEELGGQVAVMQPASPVLDDGAGELIPDDDEGLVISR